jgi:hypothetical protein
VQSVFATIKILLEARGTPVHGVGREHSESTGSAVVQVWRHITLHCFSKIEHVFRDGFQLDQSAEVLPILGLDLNEN